MDNTKEKNSYKNLDDNVFEHEAILARRTIKKIDKMLTDIKMGKQIIGDNEWQRSRRVAYVDVLELVRELLTGRC